MQAADIARQTEGRKTSECVQQEVSVKVEANWGVEVSNGVKGARDTERELGLLQVCMRTSTHKQI